MRCEHKLLAQDLAHWIDVCGDLEYALGAPPGRVDCLDAVSWTSLLALTLSQVRTHQCQSRKLPQLARRGVEVLARCEELLEAARGRSVFEVALYGDGVIPGLVQRRDADLAGLRAAERAGSRSWSGASLHADLSPIEHLDPRERVVVVSLHEGGVSRGGSEAGDPEDARRACHEQQLLWGGQELAVHSGSLSLRSGPAGWMRWYGVGLRDVAGVLPAEVCGIEERVLSRRLEVVAGLGCTSGQALVEGWETSADVLAGAP